MSKSFAENSNWQRRNQAKRLLCAANAHLDLLILARATRNPILIVVMEACDRRHAQFLHSIGPPQSPTIASLAQTLHAVFEARNADAAVKEMNSTSNASSQLSCAARRTIESNEIIAGRR